MRGLIRSVGAVVLVAAVSSGVVATRTAPVSAANPLRLVISPTSFIVPLLPAGLDDPPMVVNVTNEGVDAVVMNGSVASVGGFVATTDCQGVTLAPGDSCQMSYSYQPLPSTAADVTSTGNWNGQAFSIGLHGSSTAGLLISPTGLDFGVVPSGFASAQPLTVTATNLDRHPVTMSGTAAALAGPNGDQFSVDRSDCINKTLVQGASCTMTYAFAPTSPAGTKTSTASGSWNGQAYSIALRGETGTAAPFTISPTSFDFGSGYFPDPPAAQTATITNPQHTTITITSINNLAGPYNPAVVGPGCVGAVLAFDDSCQMNITLATPNGGDITSTAGFAIAATDGSPTPVTFDDVFGFHLNSILPFALIARSFDFGDVPVGSTTAPLSIPFTNLAVGDYQLLESGYDTTLPFTKTADCVNATVAGHGTCSMKWVYGPTSPALTLRSLAGSFLGSGAAPISLTGHGVTTPGAPTVVAASPVNGSMTVTWQPPAGDGGSPITGYTITSLPAGVHLSVSTGSPLSAAIVVPGGIPYRFIVSAQNANGTGPGATTSSATVFSEYVPVQPERLLDTRDGTGYAGSKPVAGATVALQITGSGATSVPTDAVAVVLNVTGTAATADGFVTVWPCGQPRPLASNLNLVSGGTSPNLVVVKLGTSGKVCLFTQSGTDLVADVNGYFPATTSFRPVQPERLLDTRDPPTGYAGAKPSAGQTVVVQVTGARTTNVPADASAVVLNVTGVGATADGFVTVWPCGQSRPTASNLNLTTGSIAPNLVIAKLGLDGKVCMFTQAGTDLVADVDGWFPSGTGFRPVLPERLLETRPAQVGYSGSKPAAGAVVQLQITGIGTTQVPPGAGAVVLNVTGTGATADGFVTVWPCGRPRPTASNLNLRTGATAPNLVIVKVGDGGAVCLFTQNGTDLVADVNGWFPG